MRREPIISTKNLWHTYPDGTVAVADVTVDISPKDYVAVIGQNGSGKTTLAKHFNGILKPTKGMVMVEGKPTARYSIAELSRRIGYVFQNPDHQIFKSTVEDELAFGLQNLRLPKEEITKRVAEVIETFNLEKFRMKHPFSLNRAERRRLAIASVLTMDPEVIILDEPTTGSDPRQSYETMDYVSRLNHMGKTVIIITHNMRIVAEYAKKIIVMKDGMVLLDGATSDVLSQTHAEVLKGTFIEPPQVTRLGYMLLKDEHPNAILTVDEMYKTLAEVLGLPE
jgi:energy-coupling factor transport system ATP-binding protein